MLLRTLNKKYFDDGNVCVTGLRGRGKDMLFANLIAQRKKPYVANFDYKVSKSEFVPLDISRLNVGNDFNNFIKGDINPYVYPYPEKSDIYISDCGIYFPAQYFSRLDRDYSSLPTFFALSRHLGDCNMHINSQNLNRVWDKIREQSDYYILCKRCLVLGKFVLQSIIIYDKYQSCIDRVAPFKPLKPPVFGNSEVKARYKVHNDEMRNNYRNTYGLVRPAILIYFNKSKYDTRYFKKLLSKGDQNETFSETQSS